MKKAIALLLLVFFLLSSSVVVCANEDPPGPGIFEFIFGGTVYYKQVGITLGVLYKTCPPLETTGTWRPYDPQRPIKLYPGFTMEFDINSENGRKSDSRLKTVIKHSDKKSSAMVEIGCFEGQFGVVKYTIPAHNTGYNYVKIYSEGGERKTQDQVAGFVYFVEPNNLELLQSASVNVESTTTSSIPLVCNETGTVSVYFYDDMGLTRISDKTAKITLYANGKRLPETKGEFFTVERMRTFEGVPAGTIELRMPKNDASWMIKSKTAQWDLKKGEELIINFVRNQEGRR